MTLIPNIQVANAYPQWNWGPWDDIIADEGRYRRSLWPGSSVRLMPSDTAPPFSDTRTAGAITGPTPFGAGWGFIPSNDGTAVMIAFEGTGDGGTFDIDGTTYPTSTLTNLKAGQLYQVYFLGMVATGTTIGAYTLISSYRDPVGSDLGNVPSHPEWNRGPWGASVDGNGFYADNTKLIRRFYNKAFTDTLSYDTDFSSLPRTLLVNQAATVRVSMPRSDFFVSDNQLTSSDAFAPTAWTKNRVTITTGATEAPHTPDTETPGRADAIVVDTAAGNHQIRQNYTITANDDQVARVYVKAKEVKAVRLRGRVGSTDIQQDFDIMRARKIGAVVGETGSSFVKSDIVPLLDDWMVISLQGRIAPAGTSVEWFLQALNPADNASNFTGNGTDSFYVWRFQAGQAGFTVNLAPGEEHTIRPYRIHSIGTTANTVIKAIR